MRSLGAADCDVVGGMKTDRELLELAAKAAEFGQSKHGPRWTESEYPRNSGLYGAFWNYVGWGVDAILWNPLTDDGDALRLAVKLHFDLRFHWNGCDDQYDEVEAYTHGAKKDASEVIGFYLTGGQVDEGAATRRAIVRAAAAFGEQMP